jgi:hypothetical protein
MKRFLLCFGTIYKNRLRGGKEEKKKVKSRESTPIESEELLIVAGLGAISPSTTSIGFVLIAVVSSSPVLILHLNINSFSACTFGFHVNL